MDMTSLLMFCGALLLNAGTPGPSIAALVARTVSSGWRDVLPFVAAMWVGEVIWLSAALAGLVRLAEAFHLGFVALKWAGIAYLLWLAVKMWGQKGAETPDVLPARSRPSAMFAAGLGITLGNPKIMVFYLALLPSLIDVTQIGSGAWLILALATLICLSAVDLTWLILAEKARGLLKSPGAVRRANRIGAGAMGCAAGAIAVGE